MDILYMTNKKYSHAYAFFIAWYLMINVEYLSSESPKQKRNTFYCPSTNDWPVPICTNLTLLTLHNGSTYSTRKTLYIVTESSTDNTSLWLNIVNIQQESLILLLLILKFT